MTRHSNVGVAGAGALRLVEGEQRELGVGPVLGCCRLRVRGAGRLPRRGGGGAVAAERDGGGGGAPCFQQLAAVEVCAGV